MTTVIFFGTPQFSVPSLERLISTPDLRVAAVVTQPDRPSGRGGIVTASPIKLCAERHGIPVFQPHSLRKEFTSLRPKLDALGPFDIGVVIAFGQILPAEVLEFPKQGCINVHASILPRWRGAAPIQRAVEAGDAETGVCLMKMDVGLDTGAVFSVARTPINESDTGGSLHDRLSAMGAELLARDIEKITTGALKAIPQEADGVTYAKKISSDETRIDWSLSAEQIDRKLRALSPHPGCYSIWDDKRLKIIRSQVIDGPQSTDSPPGSILQALPDTLTIQCGFGALRIIEVQLEGKRKMLVEEFMRGSAMRSGVRLR
ncbi:MAG: methionyl-tRNA formyltransferase [Pseudomonadota bacterium]